MDPDARRVALIKIHKKWADGLTLIWMIIVFLLFAAVYYLFDQAGLPATERDGAFILLGTIIVVAAVWQAVGLGLARVHMIAEKLDLARPAGGSPRP